ncbi:MAG: hypothetical protein SGJ24_08345 [Chloroflexota bacterium]|nr:hypothetical protein [Chloroflexota bacterium]
MISKNGVTDRFDEAKEKLSDDLQDAADQISAEAVELARELRQTADEARKGMIRTLNESALNLRQGTRDAGGSPEIVGAVDQVAKGFERAASYLDERTVDEIRQDAEQTIKQNSTLIIIVVLIVGVILGVLLRGSGDKK